MFKRAGMVAFLVVGLMIAGILVAGCGEQTPVVKTESASPQNLVCKGVVYGNGYVRESIYYDSHVIGPVVGAIVSLVGSYETKSAVTDANGEYVFENVKYGNYRVEVTKEGYQRGEGYLGTEGMLMFAAAAASSVRASAVPDGAIFTEDLDMWVNPVMRAVSPKPYSTIETDAAFVITFNKPMDTSSVRPRIVSAGVRTFAAGDTVNVSTAWSAGDTVLTITPLSPLLPNEVYFLYLANSEFSQVKDKDGYMLATATSYSYGVPVEEHGNVIENNDYFTYYTSSGGAPGAPGNLSVVVEGKIPTSDATTGIDYGDVLAATAAGDVALNWTGGSGNITGYKIYVADSAAHNYALMATAANNVNYHDADISDVTDALFGGGAKVDPIGTANYPMINRTLYFKVVAYNGDAESPSTDVSVRDQVSPRVNTEAYSGRTGGGFTAAVLANNYYLSALVAGTDTRTAYVAFREALDPSTVTADNFTFSAGNVTEAVLLTSGISDLDPSGSWASAVYSIVRVTVDADFAATQTITVGSGVIDLSGNTASGTGTATIQ